MSASNLPPSLVELVGQMAEPAAALTRAASALYVLDEVGELEAIVAGAGRAGEAAAMEVSDIGPYGPRIGDNISHVLTSWRYRELHLAQHGCSREWVELIDETVSLVVWLRALRREIARAASRTADLVAQVELLSSGASLEEAAAVARASRKPRISLAGGRPVRRAGEE